MSTPYEVPLTSESQTFSIEMAGKSYTITVVWNESANVWVLDFADALGVPLLRGIPLVANVDLLEPYPYMNFGGSLIAQTDSSPNTPPSYDNLGSSGRLYFVVS